MGRKFAAVLCSTLLLSPGWLGGTGFTLLFGLVPLLWISDSYDASRRSWWKVFGWALLRIHKAEKRKKAGAAKKIAAEPAAHK